MILKDPIAMFPTVVAAWQKVGTWWLARSNREQWLLGTFAMLLALWLLAAAVVLPLQRSRAAALADIRTYESLSARIRSAGTLGTAGSAPSSGSPPQILATLGSQFGIMPNVTSQGTDLQVMVADASYDNLLRWIAAVEQLSGLRVTRLRFTRRPASGFVSAELTVRT